MRHRYGGFTLIELIMVVAILAILAAVAIPAYLGMADKAHQGVEIAYATNIADAINIHNSIHLDDPIAEAEWTTQEELAADLSPDFTPKFSDGEAFSGAVGRIQFTSGVATVDTTIH